MVGNLNRHENPQKGIRIINQKFWILMFFRRMSSGILMSQCHVVRYLLFFLFLDYTTGIVSKPSISTTTPVALQR